MKNHMTAEKFEEEFAKLQARCDRAALRLSEFMMKKTKALHDQLDDDQKERVYRRFIAREHDLARRIIVPKNQSMN